MNSAVNFILESGVSLSLLAIIYVFFLRKETFFRANRLFLLGSVLFSLILPFLKFRILAPQPTMLSEVTVTPYRNLIDVVTVYSHGLSGEVERAILSTDLLIIAYFLGVAYFLVRFLIRIGQLALLIHKNRLEKTQGYKLVILEKEISPFSFLGYVFVSHSLINREGYDRMLAHELEHVKQGHTFDVLILEILTVFQWFNPFMWLLRRAIRENHEYLADQAVLNSGVKRGYYKKLLLNQFVGGQLVITNNFNYSLIKKRIKMMSKIKSSKLALSKIVFGILVAGALIIAFACEQKETIEPDQLLNEQKVVVDFDGQKLTITGSDAENVIKKLIGSEKYNVVSVENDGIKYLTIQKNTRVVSPTTKSGEEIFFIVEDMPEFPGGETALREYLGNHVKYPEIAQKNGIQGKVYVTFTVTKTGTIADAKIARGVDPSLDQEALRVVNELPQWKPGKQRGQNVNVQYTVPINFKLQ